MGGVSPWLARGWREAQSPSWGPSQVQTPVIAYGRFVTWVPGTPSLGLGRGGTPGWGSARYISGISWLTPCVSSPKQVLSWPCSPRTCAPAGWLQFPLAEPLSPTALPGTCGASAHTHCPPAPLLTLVPAVPILFPHHGETKTPFRVALPHQPSQGPRFSRPCLVLAPDLGPEEQQRRALQPRRPPCPRPPSALKVSAWHNGEGQDPTSGWGSQGWDGGSRQGIQFLRSCFLSLHMQIKITHLSWVGQTVADPDLLSTPKPPES